MIGDLRALLFAGEPAQERVHASGSDHGQLSQADFERGSRRLARWRGQAPFDDDGLWNRRLTAEGISEQTLLKMLGAPAGHGSGSPWWALRAMEDLGRTSEVYERHAGWLFLPLAAPLAATAMRRVRDLLSEHADVFADRGRLMDGLFIRLGQQIDDMVARSAILELHLAKLRGDLEGASPEKRFASFTARFDDPLFRAYFFGTYPVLCRQIVVAADNWAVATSELLQRLIHDRQRIASEFNDGRDIGVVESITTGLGDRHRGGRTVASMTWTSGTRVIYKPRPLTGDAHFETLISWLTERGFPATLRTIRCVVCDGYGWEEYVSYKTSDDPSDLHRYYFRLGGLLALLYLLCANDFHSENVIACGLQPVLVDLESLVQPVLRLPDERMIPSEQLANEVTTGSVLRVGLLPSRAWRTAHGDGADLSAIGATGGGLTPLELPHLEHRGTDLMRLGLRRIERETSQNQPWQGSSPQRALQFTDAVVDGFTRAYDILLSNRKELEAADGPLEAFRDDEVRVIARHTVQYGMLHQTSFHPDVLRDALDRERHFDRLWQSAVSSPRLADLVPAERLDLWNNDIPIFTVHASEHLIRGNATRISGLISRSGMDNVRDRLARLGDDDLAQQRWLIRAAMATTAADASDELVYPTYSTESLDVDTRAVDKLTLLRDADAVGQQLCRLAFHAEGEVEWFGVNSTQGKNWSLGPLGPDLYHGLAGIAVFLSSLYNQTRESEYLRLATAALDTADRQVQRGTLAGTGGMTGLPGVIYALQLCSASLSDEHLLDRAFSYVPLLGDSTAGDGEHDIASGNAGTIIVLRRLHNVHRTGDLLAAIQSAAYQLAAAQGPQGGWLSASINESGLAISPLGGLAHGAGGIAWALLEAWAAIGAERYRAAALSGIAYERSLYEPEVRNWRDLRDPEVVRAPNRDGLGMFLTAWCHGASGIGLARSLCRQYWHDTELDDEVTSAVETTLADGFGENHSLCHGDLGNLDIVGTAARSLATPRWNDQADHRLRAVMASMDAYGWICGMPQGVQTPGLMTGLAGIGYGILHLANSSRAPSVLSLDTATELH